MMHLGSAPGMGVDTFTLFAANAVILAVLSLAFLAAWRGQRSETCWLSWAWGNAVLAVGLVSFMFAPPGFPGVLILGNLLLVVGFGLRWRAAREFSGRSRRWSAVMVPLIVAASVSAMPGLFARGTVFTIVNLILTLQTAAVVWEFWRDRADGLPSRYGLLFAYGVVTASFAARVAQGLADMPNLASYLPLDGMLQAHLLVAVVHTTSAGAFALSIGYERGARALERAAMRDGLTDLHNRRAFELRVRECLAQAPDRPLALVLFDLDRFKEINDRFGHAAGDAALRAFAEICSTRLRSADLVARVGGEEFAALLPDVSAEEAFELTEGVRLAVEAQEIDAGGDRFRLTLSAGIFHGQPGTSDFDAIMRRADESLYRAKSDGRNRVIPAAA